VVNHVVFAEPDNEWARLLQADALEQLGFQSESGPWRDFYLTGAMELRSNGTVLKGIGGSAMGRGLVRSMTPELLLDLMGVRLNGPRAESFALEANLEVVDRDDERWAFGVRHGVLHARRNADHANADVTIRSSIVALADFASGARGLDELMTRDDFEVAGSVAMLEELVGYLDVFEFGFEIVLP
jgi:alkyl sulfatase BDS1-like metallo-beta-lactamase superfamily hydrolase